jgi:hypothetical protein
MTLEGYSLLSLRTFYPLSSNFPQAALLITMTNQKMILQNNLPIIKVSKLMHCTQKVGKDKLSLPIARSVTI